MLNNIAMNASIWESGLLSPEDIRRLERKARERAAVRFQRELEHFKD